MNGKSWVERPIEPFGMEIEARLEWPLAEDVQQRMIALFDEHKLLVFRNQKLNEADQVRVLENFGSVLSSHGEYREISSDGALGAGPLTWHSDLAFTEEPYKIISLHAVEVNDGQSWTQFANGAIAARDLPGELIERLEGLQAVTSIASIQSHRVVGYDTPSDIPHQVRPILMPHPRTGEPILYISWMQTCRIEGMGREESDAPLQQLFDELYRQDRIYRHEWNNGDFVIWDNIALQHSRCDLEGMLPRRLQRIVIADKSFFDLLPQFKVGDEKISAWGSGAKELTLN
ncbi:hypothetical protein MB02_00260 [Croceicoccus estronivorus]|uniref:TauD/TfdA dioxygenase family protein n=1 Tax=Croceicoccus estronivorus TaxID=1172626 RepID=UPI000832DFD0|nr:TauD/TfdA family dioxygenase [Croceicoccus estronivorus]OCC25167.1 hypothetical protein MB02_00260 [Croceicoccus estronivorus]